VIDIGSNSVLCLVAARAAGAARIVVSDRGIRHARLTALLTGASRAR